jgi:hypothetical protein
VAALLIVWTIVRLYYEHQLVLVSSSSFSNGLFLPFSSTTTTTSSADAAFVTFTRNITTVQQQPALPLFQQPSLQDIIATPDKSDSSSSSLLLPTWFEDYVTWHHQQVTQLTLTKQWKQHRYLVVRCLATDKHCSGASDRLQAMPLYVLLAHQSRRILYIYWERPCALEAFLQPVAPLNWTLPTWLVEPMKNLTANMAPWWLLDDYSKRRWLKLPQRVVAMKNLRMTEYYNELILQNRSNHSNNNNNMEQQPSFQQVYRRMWFRLFQWSPAVLQRVEAAKRKLQLVDEHQPYIGVHVRALYTSNGTSHRNDEQAALQCARQLARRYRNTTTTRIFLASDSLEVTMRALTYNNQDPAAPPGAAGTLIVTRSSSNGNTTPPLHLDRGNEFLKNTNDWKLHSAADYYDTFVDLALLAGAQCVVYGAGGYGQWASLMSANPLCARNYRESPCHDEASD